MKKMRRIFEVMIMLIIMVSAFSLPRSVKAAPFLQGNPACEAYKRLLPVIVGVVANQSIFTPESWITMQSWIDGQIAKGLLPTGYTSQQFSSDLYDAGFEHKMNLMSGQQVFGRKNGWTDPCTPPPAQPAGETKTVTYPDQLPRPIHPAVYGLGFGLVCIIVFILWRRKLATA